MSAVEDLRLHVAQLTIKPGDVLVVQSEREITREQADHIKAALQFGVGVPIVVLGPKLGLAMMSVVEETRDHRPDETSLQKAERELVEGHVDGVERAANDGLLSRKQAERVTEAGKKGTRSHDLARGVRGAMT